MTTDNYSYRPPIRYGEIWGASFRLAWQRPSLWIWGFFIAGGPFYIYQLVVYGPGYDVGFKLMEAGISSYMTFVTVALVAFLAFESFFAPVLIHSVAEIESKSHYDVGMAIGEGAAKWGWFMGYTFLTFFVVAIVIFGAVLLGIGAGLISKWLAALAFIVLVPVSLIIGLALAFVVVYARRIAVIERRGFVESVYAGYEFLMNNKGSTAVVTITLVGVLFGVGIISGIVMMISMFSSGGVPTTMEDYQPISPGMGTWILGLLNLIWAAVYGTVMTNLYTILYLRLRPRRVPPTESTAPPGVVL